MSEKPSRNIEHLMKFSQLTPLREPVMKPKAGFEYIFQPEVAKKLSDWRADGYHWRQSGSMMVNFDGIECKKLYFYVKIGHNKEENKAIISREFLREVYFHPDYPNQVLIIYSGDESIAVPLCHGNSKFEKKLSADFMTTRKSLRMEMKERKGCSSIIFSELMQQAPSKDVRGVTAPRDIVQIRNAQSSARHNFRLSVDTNYILREIASDTNFISEIACYPHFLVFCFLPSLLEQARELLKRSDIARQSFSYDTTYLLGDFYVSALVLCFNEFEEDPPIPVMVMIHEKKTKATHGVFWKKVVKYLPEIEDALNVYITSDEERAIEAIQEQLPNTSVFRCWNHLADMAKLKLLRIGIVNRELLSRYVNDIHHLITQPSLHDYQLELIRITSKVDYWHPNFIRYFKKYTNPEINKEERWEVMRDGGDSITIKRSESFNQLINCLQDWSDAPIDSVVLSFGIHLKGYEIQILRARSGQGDFTLRSHVFPITSDSPINYPEIHSPETIVARIKEEYLRPRSPEPSESEMIEMESSDESMD